MNTGERKRLSEKLSDHFTEEENLERYHARYNNLHISQNPKGSKIIEAFDENRVVDVDESEGKKFCYMKRIEKGNRTQTFFER